MLTFLFAVLMPVLSARAAGDQKTGAKPPTWNGFVGDSGFVVEYPPGFKADPSFQDPEGKLEVVQFWPKGHCAGRAERDCAARDGWFNLLVIPKDIISRYNHVDSFSDYVSAVKSQSASGGEKPSASAAKNKRLRGVVLLLGQPAGPFSAMAYFEGKKVYYRFSYDKGNTAIKRVVASLSEGQ